MPLFLLFLLGALHVAPAAGAAPEWVTHLGQTGAYPPSQFLTGFGSSDASLAAAEELARNDLARSIQVTVEGQQEWVVRETQGAAGMTRAEWSFFQERSGSRHHVVLEGVELKRYEHDGHYYVLAVLARERAQRSYRQRVRGACQRSAAALGSQGTWTDSVQGALRAATLASGALADANLLRTLGGDGSRLDSVYALRGRALARLAELLRNIQVVGSDPDGRAVWGQALPQPLRVRLTRNGQALAQVPIRFAFVRGSGRLVTPSGEGGADVHTPTDGTGQATCRVARVASVTGDLRIHASLALAALAAADDAPAVDVLTRGLVIPGHTFHVATGLWPTPPPRVLSVQVDGAAAERSFADGAQVVCTVALPGPVSAYLLHIDAHGRLTQGGHLDVRDADSGPGWSVSRVDDALMWRFQATMAAQQGAGVETLIAVALPPGAMLNLPAGGCTDARELRAVLDAQGGAQWAAGWVSYEIRMPQ